jgi:hypothetical protein
MALFGRNRGRLETDNLTELAHPVRFWIITLFTQDTDRSLTADSLTADLTNQAPDLGKLTLAQVAYHVARLQDAALLPAE